MSCVTNEHLELLKRFDQHLRWIRDGHYKKDDNENLDFDILLKFHLNKLDQVLMDLADYFGAKRDWVQREPDTQIDPNKLGTQPGVPVAEREKVRLHKKYGDVFNDEAKNIDERWR